MEKLGDQSQTERQRSHGEKGVFELVQLLQDPAFQEGFIVVQTTVQRDQLAAAYKDRDIAVEQQIKPLIEAKAVAVLGASTIEEARKLGKKWGEALKSVTEVAITTEDGLQEKKPIEEVRGSFRRQIESSSQPIILKNKQEVEQAEITEGTRIAGLQIELESRKNDPALLAAMNVWGKSPDATGDFGPVGKGFHAGVIHYFAYRAHAEKNGRYKYSKYPLDLDGYIAYSNYLKGLIEHPDPQQYPEISVASCLGDGHGNRRLYVLTSYGEFIVGFQRATEGKQMRVITVFPGKTQKDLVKAVNAELEGKNTSRLNILQGERKVIPY